MTPVQLAAFPWQKMQEELWSLAFLLGRRGDHEGTELAITISARIGELLADEQTVVALSQLPPSCRFELRNLIGAALRANRSNRTVIP